MILYKSATLSRFEAKKAILLLENGQELSLLKEELEGNPPEGTAFLIQIMPQQEGRLQKESLARTLLNQILDDTVLPTQAELD